MLFLPVAGSLTCVQVFANRYSECSGAESGLSSDMVFILSFSTIMLNTDLHNKSIKSHMTKEEFIRNHRGEYPMGVLMNEQRCVYYSDMKSSKSPYVPVFK